MCDCNSTAGCYKCNPELYNIKTMNKLNPLKGNQREQLKRLSCDDAGRKIDELVNAFNELQERIEFLEVEKETDYIVENLNDDKNGLNSYGDDICFEKEKIKEKIINLLNKL